ncbi:odorant receptor 46a-like isoform X2 [Plodia interpunctella]|uniref:odorant receptor 46a-like isoform X2 n=1 Tax=Plodia interpunctella TaxID=58824 RepID=UPI0023678EEB|nr:odorant receptor 46a-like isoform X2 [Plodia interpunctella]
MELYSTYESIRPHFEALAYLGYFKIVMKDVSRTKRILHNCYRGLVGIAVLLYIFQHFISVVQARNNTDKMADTLFILLTVLTCVAKQMAFNVRAGRLEQLLSSVNGPMFAATNPHNLGLLKANARSMRRLLTTYQMSVTVTATLWAILPLINRALSEEVKFTGYIPFDTQNTITFVIVVVYMNFLIGFQGNGNVTLDCTIVALYALARVQVQMLRYNLEHMADDEGNMVMENKKHGTGVYQRRLEKFYKEVESIFAEAMTFQFLVIAWVICMTVYKIVGMALFSAEFVSILAYLLIILGQLFIYCYYGSLFKIETEYINQSVYFSDWLSFDPGFRRQLLVFMTHCVHPIKPMVANIVPITMDTYITVLKSSYSLFTFLDRH